MKEKILHELSEKLLSGSYVAKKQIHDLLRLAEKIEKDKKTILTKQFEQSHSFYLLIKGKVKFSIRLENIGELYGVGDSTEKYTPVGWSGFRYPNRYATTVTCEEKTVLLRWAHKDLEKFFKIQPAAGRDFLFFVFRKSLILLNHVRQQLVEKTTGDSESIFPGLSKDVEKQPVDINVDPLDILRQSPFFEVFPEKFLVKFAEISKIRTYVNGEMVFAQGKKSRGFDLLAFGSVVRFFSLNASGKSVKLDLSDSIALRSVSYPGYVVGWSGVSKELKCGTTAVASRDSIILHFEKKDIDKILIKNPEFGLLFAKRLLWLVANFLRNNRAKLISEQYELELIAVNSIIEQNATQLAVDSGLHKLPHLLSNVLTLDDAFTLLFELEKKGDSLEKALSRSCFDILGRVYREFRFYDGLRKTYNSVAAAPKSKKPQELRVLSAEKFAEAFADIPFILEGRENLPEKPGCIFIFNHLLNHPYNTLPNNFQITLDSHFVSSVILYKKYGDPGIRIVRLPRADEYGHQNYYGRLGHINVFTSESDILEESADKVKAKTRDFYKQAKNIIKNGNNLIINPEGKSFKTDDSPGPFRGGAFLLAASMNPEPLIVPIALANFDKKVNRNIFSAIIKKPFYITDHVDNPVENKSELFEFLADYRNTYRNYVEEALQLAEKAAVSKFNLKYSEKVFKEEK